MSRTGILAPIWALAVGSVLLLAACGSGSGTAAGGTGTASSGAAQTGTAASGGAYSAGTSGNFVMVKLTPNEQIFAQPGQGCPATLAASGTGPCFDQGGYNLDATDPALPNKGAAGVIKPSGTPFYFLGNGGGKAGGKEALNFGPEHGPKVSVNVPQGKYTKLLILGSAGNGNQPAAITFTYTDGSTGSATQNFDDWCGQPQDGAVAYTLTDRLDASTGQPNGCSNSVYLDIYTVAVSSSSKTLKSISFDSTPGQGSGNFEPEILALTLEK